MERNANDVDLGAIRVCVDKELSTIQRLVAAGRAVRENPENAPSGSAAALPKIGVGRSTLLTFGAVLTGKKWKNGRELRVRHLNGDPNIHARVEQCARQWQPFANITFAFVEDPQAEIRIWYSDDNQSWSWIGTDALTVPLESETMHYGWLTPATSDDEARRVIVHEFGHALGLIHEHQSPEADIHWDKPVVYRYYMERLGWPMAQVDSDLFTRCTRDETQFDAYDPKSIMHYPIPPEFTTDHVEVGWNRELSPTDKRFIGRVYPRAMPAGAQPPPAGVGSEHTQWRVEWQGSAGPVGQG